MAVTMSVILFWGTVLTQRVIASPFSTIDFSNFPNSPLKKEKISVVEVHDKLKELEKRFNESLETRSSTSSQSVMETRMKELQEQFEGVQHSEVDDNETKQKVEQMAVRLDDLQKKVSSASSLRVTVDGLQAKVAADSEKNHEDINNLKTTSRETQQKVTAMQAEVKDVKAKVERNEKELEEIKLDVKKIKDSLVKNPQLPGTKDTPSPDVPAPPRGPVCPESFHFDKEANVCLNVVSSRMTKSEAERECAELANGGVLAVPNTDDKLRAVQNYLRQKEVTVDVFVAGRYDANSGGFLWPDDSSVKMSWCPYEPTTRPCMSLWARQGFCLDDSWCDSFNPFVCEVPMEVAKVEQEDVFY